MKKISFKKLTWIDFENPDSSTTRYLQENFNIHPLAIEEFITPTIRPKATVYSNCIFLTLHIPLYDNIERTTYPGELDIVITKDHLITGHDHKIFQLTEFFEKLQNSEGKRKIYMSETSAHLLYHLVELLVESCFPRLDHIHRNIDIIEKHVFNGDEKEMVREISIAKRDVLNFRRTLKPQRSILESLAQMDTKLIHPELRPYYQDLVGTNIRLWSSLESAKETIESLEETNNSLLSNNLNLTMKVLTIFSAVMLPMTVYSNILAMSAGIPFGTHPYGFWIHMGIMFILSMITIFLFKLKKWI
ncbi:MAG: magnesium transporter CorA family protein [Candidatus Moraniibacteriota bacterium]